MNAPFEKPTSTSSQEKKESERLVSPNSEQKILVVEIRTEIASDITIFEDSLETITEEEVREMQSIYTEAEKIYNTLVELISNFEADIDISVPESELNLKIEEIKSLHQTFTQKKTELISNLTSRGYEVVDSPVTNVETQKPTTTDNFTSVSQETVKPEVPTSQEGSAKPTKDEILSKVDSENIDTPKSSAEADESSEYISVLAEMYRAGDRRVFKVPPGNGGLKKLKVIAEEIKLVLNHEGYSPDIVSHFLNEIVNRIHFDIRENGRLKAKEKDPTRFSELTSIVDKKYQELLDEVSNFLQTEKIVTESVIEDGDQIEGEIDERIASVNAEYEALREKFKEAGLVFAKSETIKKIGYILDLIASIHEKDATIIKVKKEKYLKSFLAEIENLKLEIAEAIKTKSQPKSQPTKIVIPPLDVPTTEQNQVELNTEVSVEDELSPQTASTVDSDTQMDEVILREQELISNNSNESDTTSTESVASSERPVNETLINHYHEHRKQALEAKQVFKDKEIIFQDRLKTYYENQSLLSKAYSGTRKLFGLKPKLPMELEKMQSEYKEARKLYAFRLNEALEMRGFAHVGNKEFIAGSDKSKRAFGSKFILKPYQELIKIQEEVIKDQEAKSRLNKILGLASRHKTLTRVVGLTAVAGVGAATGGLLGAGVGATRFLVSTFGGATAAAYTAKKMQTGVEVAKQKGKETRDQAMNEFSLENLDSLDNAILEADQKMNQAELRQKTATIGTAFAVAGSSAFAASYIPDLSPASTLPDNSKIDVPAGEVVKPKIVLDGDAPVMRPSIILNGDEAVEFVHKNPETVVVDKIDTKPLILKEISVTPDNLPDAKLGKVVVTDVKLDGSFKSGALTTLQQSEINKVMRLSIDDMLSAHPNISKSVLEIEVYQKLHAKFGNETWWKNANISRVEIGSISNIDSPNISGTEVDVDTGRTAVVEKVEGEVGVEKNEISYKVRPGDTLWSIIEKQFAEDLKDLPASKKMEVLDRLFERIEGDPDLKASLGLKSGDIDLIYPNEKINLDGVSEVLDRAIEREDIIELFKKSAPIPVEVDSTIVDIPISVTEDDIPQVFDSASDSPKEVTTHGKEVGKEPLSTLAKDVSKAPRPFVLDGNYFEHPDYRAYVKEVFVTEKAFSRVLEVAVDRIDNATYDIFSKGIYDSPYYFMEDMTMTEIEEFQKLPNSEVRAILQINNIKYDTYLAWLDKLDEMKDKLPYKPETKLSDLFSRHVAENMVTRQK